MAGTDGFDRKFATRGDFGTCDNGGDRLSEVGALDVLGPSLRLDRVVPGVTVWLLVTLGAPWFGAVDAVSAGVSVMGRVLLACATASGPAHAGNSGTPTLASTKLARTVTGRTFSVIFSWRPELERPKTMCWTLLYTRLHVWKACACGVDARSCK